MNTLTAKNEILNEFDSVFHQLDLIDEKLTKEVRMFTEEHYIMTMSEVKNVKGTLTNIDECIRHYNVDKCTPIVEKTKSKLKQTYTYKLGY